MKVAVYYNNKDVRVQEIPIPKIGWGEILVRVVASGICGSDVMEWYRVKKTPRVLGHEITGYIAEVGEGVDDYNVGQRVFVSHHVPCNTCQYCLSGAHTACDTLHNTNYDPGGFSEYIRIPKINVENGVYVLPDDMTYEEGTFIEPLACVMRGQRLAGLKPGKSVLVIGSGISGLMHVKLAKATGAGKIFATDINDYRLNAAKRFGADAVFNAKDNIHDRIKEANDGHLADLVIVCAGALQASLDGIKCVERGGTVLFFAVPEPEVMVPVPMNDLWRNEITLMTSYGAGPDDLEAAIDIMRSKRISFSDMITHRLPLEKAQEGFSLVADAKESIKVILEPDINCAK